MIKKRIKNRLVNASFKKFSEFIDMNQIENAAKLVVNLVLILFPTELFNELRYANTLIKFKERR